MDEVSGSIRFDGMNWMDEVREKINREGRK